MNEEQEQQGLKEQPCPRCKALGPYHKENCTLPLDLRYRRQVLTLKCVGWQLQWRDDPGANGRTVYVVLDPQGNQQAVERCGSSLAAYRFAHWVLNGVCPYGTRLGAGGYFLQGTPLAIRALTGAIEKAMRLQEYEGMRAAGLLRSSGSAQ